MFNHRGECVTHRCLIVDCIWSTPCQGTFPSWQGWVGKSDLRRCSIYCTSWKSRTSRHIGHQQLILSLALSLISFLDGESCGQRRSGEQSWASAELVIVGMFRCCTKVVFYSMLCCWLFSNHTLGNRLVNKKNGKGISAQKIYLIKQATVLGKSRQQGKSQQELGNARKANCWVTFFSASSSHLLSILPRKTRKKWAISKYKQIHTSLVLYKVITLTDLHGTEYLRKNLYKNNSQSNQCQTIYTVHSTAFDW